MTTIAYSEINFHPQSIADYKTRLFQWQGQIYRGVGSERAPFFKQLFADGVIKELVDQKLLIESELVNLEIDEFDIVVKHKAIPFQSYALEWCAAMIKDATLLLLDFSIELAKRGYALEDGHLKNVLFDGSKPIFVDLGSIRPLDEYVYYSRWDAYEQFCQSCLHPLILMAQEKDRIARLLMVDNDGISKSDVILLTRDSKLPVQIPKPPLLTQLQLTLRQMLPPAYIKLIKQSLAAIQSSPSKQSQASQTSPESGSKFAQAAYLKLLQTTRQDIEAISLLSKESKSNSCSESCHTTLHNDWMKKQSNVHQVLAELKPASVLDIGCGSGFYSKLAATLGSQVVAIDKDASAITQLYYDSRNENLSILPLVMDFAQPTPARGLSDHLFTAASDRLQCDLVLALGIVHELACGQHPQFEQIIEGFAKFSKRWLLVEFIQPHDQEFIRLQLPHPAWYTPENFMSVLKQWFYTCVALPTNSKSRLMFLCKK